MMGPDGVRIRAPYVGAIVTYKTRETGEQLAAVVTRVHLEDDLREMADGPRTLPCSVPTPFVSLHVFVPAGEGDIVPAMHERCYEIDVHCSGYGIGELGAWWWPLSDVGERLRALELALVVALAPNESHPLHAGIRECVLGGRHIRLQVYRENNGRLQAKLRRMDEPPTKETE